MVKVHSKALDSSIEVGRIIGQIDGTQPGPCLIFIGGVHGNEPSGVFALNQVMHELQKKAIPIRGTVIALAGNLWALERCKRYQEEDLNRLWRHRNTDALKDGTFKAGNADEEQQIELYSIIQELLSTKDGPFYFFDLHTTSSMTAPFMTVNDSLLNRKFTQQYPVPMILGIEEYLDGPLLSFINGLGYVSFGFESGQHHELSSIQNHVSFTYLSLVFTGAVAEHHVEFEQHYSSLNNMPDHIYEIYFRYQIEEKEEFSMQPGFLNFQAIRKRQLLALSENRPVFSTSNSTIFMPLYQDQGSDGFFLIRRIPPILLLLSSWLRRWRFDRILPLMPGIKWLGSKRDSLIVDQKIARFMTKQFLHILGYRSKKVSEHHMIVRNREAASRNDDYREENWS